MPSRTLKNTSQEAKDAPRKRWKPAPAQKSFLEAFFLICDLPNRVTVDALSRTLNIDQRQVRIWFQNRRQRLRKEHGTTKDASDSGGKTDTRDEAASHPFATFSSTPGMEPFLLGHMTAAWAIVTGTPAEALKGETSPAPAKDMDFHDMLAASAPPSVGERRHSGSTTSVDVVNVMSGSSDAESAPPSPSPVRDSFSVGAVPTTAEAFYDHAIPAGYDNAFGTEAWATAPAAPQPVDYIRLEDLLEGITVDDMCRALDM